MRAEKELTDHVVQANHILDGQGEDKGLDFSMRQESSQVLHCGTRIAQCMIRCGSIVRQTTTLLYLLHAEIDLQG